MIAVPTALLYPLIWVSGRVDLFASKLRPETITAILGARLGAELILTFFLVGAITRLYLWRMEASR